MIELLITYTAKSYHPSSKWACVGQEKRAFPGISEAKAFLREQYPGKKRVPMYRDTPNGKPKQTGYVIGYRNADYSHAPIERWLSQDWIEFRESKTLNLNEEN